MKRDCAYTGLIKNISQIYKFDAVLGKQWTSCSQTLFSSLKPFFKLKTQTLSLSLSLLTHSHFGYATLMSCKYSETEHILTVVPISAGFGAGFNYKRLLNASGKNMVFTVPTYRVCAPLWLE